MITENIENYDMQNERAVLLGPIIEHYLRKLDSQITALDDGNTAFLFLTRAGFRIMEAYKLYLAHFDRSLPKNAHLFWSSRLLICKGISGIEPTLSINTIGREFANNLLDETIKAVMASRFGVREALRSHSERLPVQSLHEFIKTGHPVADQLSSYLGEQSLLFREYLQKTVGSAKRIVIIDSGWAGTSQQLLARSFTKFEWIGLYFGWMNDTWDSVTDGEAYGLIFNANTYDPEYPESAICLHRHLIESLFEPNAPSVEELVRNRENGLITGIGSDLIFNEQFDLSSDPNYVAVLSHLRKSNLGDIARGVKSYQEAIVNLAKRLSHPTTTDAKLLAGKTRSADFGRDIKVPVLIPSSEKIDGETPQQRITRALWPEAQIAIEYPPEKALRLQKQRLLASQKNSKTQKSKISLRPRANQGRVAIITRTKDRPILLKRAAESVANQSFNDYVWVVVNDGGDPEVVTEVITRSKVPLHKIVFCSNDKSVGMEAASNIGIRASKSEFIVIHDDDDSWHPDFLRKTIDFLDANNGQKYGAVICRSVYVSEEIDGNRVIEWGRWPYQDWVQHIHLSELIVENFFPPIAFLCRRQVCECIGLFDENLPVLGDWDFAIRFLLKADIGVLPEQLAYYHHRDRGSAGNYSNSVVGGISKHIEYNAIVRNKFIREAASKPELAVIATMMAQGYEHRDLRLLLQQVNNQQTAMQPMSNSIVPTGKTNNDQTYLVSDKHWCLVQAAKHYYSGFLGIFRRLLPFPSESSLESRIRKTKMLPPPDFDDEAYLCRYPDIAQAVKNGKFKSGFEHYAKFGKNEKRLRPQAR